MARTNSDFDLTLIRTKFELKEDGLLWNRRLEEVRRKQLDYIKSRSDNGKHGGRPRKPYGKHMESIAKAKHKAKKSSPVSSLQSPISNSDLPLQSMKMARPTIEEMKFHGEKIGLPAEECEACFHYYESNGWRVGKNPMRNWRSTMQTWKKKYDERRYQAHQPNPSQRSRPLTGAEQRLAGIPEVNKGVNAADLFNRAQQRDRVKNGVAETPPPP